MIHIIDNDSAIRLREQAAFFRHTLNTHGASVRTAGRIVPFTPADTAYVPRLASFKDPLGFCRRFKTVHPELPLAVRIPASDSGIDIKKLNELTDNIIVGLLSSVKVAEILCELSRLYTCRDFMACRAGALLLNIYTATVHVRGQLMSLTRCEISVLRHLAEAYPRPVPPGELAACTGAPGRPHTPSCVSTLLSRINQKAIERTGRPLVSPGHGEGYTLLPE